ncbi:unnamed protein product [Cylindrotheca closterium]|uniref:Autophagy-related protein n=1 Tax=Cylindrotheca closterium TaxID=2856 RepID=A0AAD2FVG1_9STRA|nr:unnamed protein product [Cylindrotheca closterium]
MTKQDTQEQLNIAAPDLPRWYPKWRGKPWYDGNQEALAWMFDGIARNVSFLGAGAFFATALLRLAKESLGCATEPLEGSIVIPECEGRVLGIKPSSLLTTYTMIIGVASALFLPLMGAMVDYTRHRLLFGQITSAIICLCIFPQIFMNEDNFIVMAILQVISSFVGWAQTALSHAYLPELTDDELILNEYNKRYTVVFFSFGVAFLIVTIAITTVIGYADNDLVTSQVAMSMAFVVNATLLPLAWGRLFKRREPMHPLPEDAFLWSAGFVQLYRTGKKIAGNYRGLKWFYLAIAMSDSGINALATIAITYNTDVLQFSALENGISLIVILIGCTPGAFLSKYTTEKFDPIKSSIFALLLLIVATALFAILIVRPKQFAQTYAIAFFWGMGMGWKWTIDRTLAALIIPEGQDAELMGFFLFSGQCLSWVPPLVYTAINEAGVSQRVGLASLDAYFILSLICYLLMGGYKQARIEVGRDKNLEKELKEMPGAETPHPDCDAIPNPNDGE